MTHGAVTQPIQTQLSQAVAPDQQQERTSDVLARIVASTRTPAQVLELKVESGGE